MENLNREGFWYSPAEPGWPRPVPHAKPWKGKSHFVELLTKLEGEAQELCYKGWSTCRICHCHNGSVTYRYKQWEWPSGFLHYIEKHNVRPSDEFIAFVESQFK